jgi:carboxymethylenebutenolidase
MGKTIELTAKDGHKFSAYRADPSGKPRGAIVVIQEIFGVNKHIRSIADRYAELGYVAIAPSVFDRAEKGFEAGYDEAGMNAGRAARGKITTEPPLIDTQAAVDAAKSAGKVAVVGYCMGGSVAFLSATRLDGVSAAVGYYGGQIAPVAEEKTKVPCMLHFGDQDHGIPLTDVEKIKKAHPDMPIFVYSDAGHGFNCDVRPSFAPIAAQVAFGRTQEFIAKHVG